MLRITSFAVLLGVLAGPAVAQFTPYIPPGIAKKWTGVQSSDWDHGPNWVDTNAPGGEGTLPPGLNDFVLFDNAFNTYVMTPSTGAAARGLAIANNFRPFFLQIAAEGLSIGSDGVVYAPFGNIYSELDGRVILTSDQIWDIRTGGLALLGNVSGPFSLTKKGAGSLIFRRTDNTQWSGNLFLQEGRIVIGSPDPFLDASYDRSLGTGTLIIGAPNPDNPGLTPMLATQSFGNYGDDGDHAFLASDIELNGLLLTDNEVDLEIDGTVTLKTDSVITALGDAVFFNGSIVGTGEEQPEKLIINSYGPVILNGLNTYTGGTHVEQGLLAFFNQSAIPQAGSLSMTGLGYVGLFDPTGLSDSAANYINKFSTTDSHGTIGFDTDPDALDDGATPSHFGAVDLSGFTSTSLRLGSATMGVITGTITPNGADYRFGNGGGTLAVTSSLTGARAVVVDSLQESSLTLRLIGENSFTGGMSLTNSAVIFGLGAIPDAPANSIAMDANSYVGFDVGAESTVSLSELATSAGVPLSTGGMIGFDGPSSRVINDAIDLSDFTGGVYLGTATYGDEYGPGVQLNGPLTPGSDGIHRFAAYKGATLSVATPLTGANTKVYIGKPDSLASFGNVFEEEYSLVALVGANSHGGTTTLFAGKLLLGHANALGTGALLVQPHSIDWEDEGDDDDGLVAGLATLSNLVVSNDVVLNAGLAIEDSYHLELTGSITGPGGIELDDYLELTLSGNNTFSGGLYIGDQALVRLGSDTAAGTGPLGFGYSGGQVEFLTANPVIHNLWTRENTYASELITMLDQTVLTINQTDDGYYSGDILSGYTTETSNTLQVVKTGPGILHLQGYGSFPGIPDLDYDNQPVSAVIQQGAVIAGMGSYNPLGNGSSIIEVGGGATLGVNNNSGLSNPIVFTGTDGARSRLIGNGSFSSHVSIGSNALLSPGFSAGGPPIGNLTFNELSLESGGILEWNIIDPFAGPGHGWDLISISSPATVYANSTVESPFTIKAISLGGNGQPGTLASIQQGDGPYQWKVFASPTVMGLENDVDLGKIFIDDSAFFTAAGGGDFRLSVGDSGNIYLNFTPVPEPSTYGLMGIGLAAMGYRAWRRRRRDESAPHEG